MVIVAEFHLLVHEYVARFPQLAFPRPDICPNCQAVHLFIGHGFYVRQPITPTQVYVVHIKRWLCKACRHTLSLLPSFLLRYRHYLLEVIEPVVVTRFEDRASWTQVAQRCSIAGYPAPRTLRRWCVSFAQHAPIWWARVQQILAQHDPGSPALDPLGENAGPRDAPRALLQAAVHLLAWAKTQWPDMVAYGWNDRLRFLWHWGASQGLGRLI
jgi:transposase-like protein